MLNGQNTPNRAYKYISDILAFAHHANLCLAQKVTKITN